MNKILTSAMLLSSLLLTACASVEPASEPATASASATKPSGSSYDQDATITGSRIPAKKTEKMVGQIGGVDYARDAAAHADPMKVQ